LRLSPLPFLLPAARRYSHCPIIDLARLLIAIQVCIDSDGDSVYLGSFWLFCCLLTAVGAGFSLYSIIVRLLLIQQRENTMASTKKFGSIPSVDGVVPLVHVHPL
jgi:hypothetical protein